MSMNMPDRIPKYVRDSHEMHEENKGTVFDTGVVNRPRTPDRPRTRAVTSEADFEDLADNGSERPAAPRPGGRKYLNDPTRRHDLNEPAKTSGRWRGDQKTKKHPGRRKKKLKNRSSPKLSAATANDPMRSETALDAEKSEAHDRAKVKQLEMHGIDRREGDDERVERKTAMQAPFQQGDGVPDWASKAFADQTLEKGPVEGSKPRGPEPADKTYESTASKKGIIAMGPGARSQAVTRTGQDRDTESAKVRNPYDPNWEEAGSNRTPMSKRTITEGTALAKHEQHKSLIRSFLKKHSKQTGTKSDAIRKLEGTGPGWQPSKRQKLKAYDPDETPSDLRNANVSGGVKERHSLARKKLQENKKQAAQRYKKPEEPLTKRESEPEPERSMLQRLKDRFKGNTQ